MWENCKDLLTLNSYFSFTCNLYSGISQYMFAFKTRYCGTNVRLSLLSKDIKCKIQLHSKQIPFWKCVIEMWKNFAVFARLRFS